MSIIQIYLTVLMDLEKWKNYKKRWVTTYNRNYGGFDYVQIHSKLLKPV